MSKGFVRAVSIVTAGVMVLGLVIGMAYMFIGM